MSKKIGILKPKTKTYPKTSSKNFLSGRELAEIKFSTFMELEVD